MVIEDTESLLKFVEARVEQNWESNKYPLLLSVIGSELSVLKSGYIDLFAPMKFREFLSTNSADRFEIVQHPRQKAKVGLIPCSKEFAFPIERETSESGDSKDHRSNRSDGKRMPGKYIVQNFLDLLSRLEPEDISKVNIPIDVIAKLMKSK